MAYEMIAGIVAQVSAMLTLVAAAVAGTFIYIAVSGLSKDRFRNIPMNALVFMILLNIGTFSMALYHFQTPFIEVVETIWYISIFISLTFSIYSSWRTVQFGKEFKRI